MRSEINRQAIILIFECLVDTTTKIEWQTIPEGDPIQYHDSPHGWNDGFLDCKLIVTLTGKNISAIQACKETLEDAGLIADYICTDNFEKCMIRIDC